MDMHDMLAMFRPFVHRWRLDLCFCFVSSGVIPQLSWVPGLTHSCGDESVIRITTTRQPSAVTLLLTAFFSPFGLSLSHHRSRLQLPLQSLHSQFSVLYCLQSAFTALVLSAPFVTSSNNNCHFQQPWMTFGKMP
jgi:hypothetical protein